MINDQEVKKDFLQIKLKNQSLFRFAKTKYILLFENLTYHNTFTKNGMILINENLDEDVEFNLKYKQNILEAESNGYCLIRIRNDTTDRANEFINNWKKENKINLQNIVINDLINTQWKNKEIEKFNDDYQELIFSLISNFYKLGKFEKELFAYIKKNIKNYNIRISNYEQIKEELFYLFNNKKENKNRK